ncbi:hypothetical protein M003_26875 [Pseudomonas aeruginosa IGB83]|nr:hypothetical protein M003_26875 [Pseudomonas aeruginosa IGB83]
MKISLLRRSTTMCRRSLFLEQTISLLGLALKQEAQ